MGVRLKKDDLVVVVAGKDKGVEGRILDIRKDGRVIVAGANIVKRHQSAQKFPEAGIIDRPAPLQPSNVMLKDPESGKPTRVRFEERDGAKVRVAVKSGAVIK
jgi:large subunit ribosomal protein L24